MSIFRDHVISMKSLLTFIPEALISKLSSSTKVDHYTKVLHGRKIFYLLFYGILENDRLSQRTLEDTFNDPIFKFLFDLDKSETVRRSSISDRLSGIDPDYFHQIYQCIYDQFSHYYSFEDGYKMNIIRVDSTMVSEGAGKLQEGLRSNQQSKRAVKFSIAFDGELPCGANLFSTSGYSSEDKALPEAVRSHVKNDPLQNNIYVLDRGLQSTQSMHKFSQESIFFVCRAKENRKYIELESFMGKDQITDLGEAILVKDSKVNLYYGKIINNKKEKKHYKETLSEQPFRLVIIKTKQEKKEFYFLTNNFDLSAKEVAEIYRKRWDIEVFFRFLKQELNLTHLVSLNKNGITVMLYMTLIVAMLLLIYKKANKIGYKTAKRRMTMELRDEVIKIIVELCGGNPNIYFKT